MQGEEFLCSPSVLEADLVSFLLPGGTMGLFDEVIAARSRDNLDVLHSVEYWKGSNARSGAPELICVDHVWNVVIRQKPSEKGLCRLGVPPILQEKIKHCTGITNGPPQPEFLAPDVNADLVQEPAGTGPEFPVSQFFSKERRLRLVVTSSCPSSTITALAEFRGAGIRSTCPKRLPSHWRASLLSGRVAHRLWCSDDGLSTSTRPTPAPADSGIVNMTEPSKVNKCRQF